MELMSHVCERTGSLSLLNTTSAVVLDTARSVAVSVVESVGDGNAGGAPVGVAVDDELGQSLGRLTSVAVGQGADRQSGLQAYVVKTVAGGSEQSHPTVGVYRMMQGGRSHRSQPKLEVEVIVMQVLSVDWTEEVTETDWASLVWLVIEGEWGE